MLVCCLFLLLAWSLVIAVDIYGPPIDPGAGHIWPLLFNRGPVEFAQWFALAWAIVVFAFSAGRIHRDTAPRVYAFVSLISVGLSLMLIEEAGDIRHTIRIWTSSWHPTDLTGLIEPLYFAALAAIPVYTVLRYGGPLLRNPRTRAYLLIGVSTYGLAAGMSAVEPWFQPLRQIGYFFHEVLPGSNLVVPPDVEADFWYLLFADGPIEETLELLGAVSFLALALAVTRAMKSGELVQLRPTSRDRSGEDGRSRGLD